MNISTKITALFMILINIIFIGVGLQANMLWWSLLLIILTIATYVVDHRIRKRDAMHPFLKFIPLIILMIYSYGLLHGSVLLKEHPLDTYIVEFTEYNRPHMDVDAIVVQEYGIFNTVLDEASTTNLNAINNYDLFPDVGLIYLFNIILFFPGIVFYFLLFVMYNNENGKTLELLEFISAVIMLVIGVLITLGYFRISSPLFGGLWIIIVMALYTLYYYLKNNKVNSALTKYIPILLLIILDSFIVIVAYNFGRLTNMLIPILFLHMVYVVMFIDHFRTVKRHSKRRELKGIIMMSGSRTGGMTAGIRNDSSFLQTTEAFIQEHAKSKLVEDVTYTNQDND